MGDRAANGREATQSQQHGPPPHLFDHSKLHVAPRGAADAVEQRQAARCASAGRDAAPDDVQRALTITRGSQKPRKDVQLIARYGLGAGAARLLGMHRVSVHRHRGRLDCRGHPALIYRFRCHRTCRYERDPTAVSTFRRGSPCLTLPGQHRQVSTQSVDEARTPWCVSYAEQIGLIQMRVYLLVIFNGRAPNPDGTLVATTASAGCGHKCRP